MSLKTETGILLLMALTSTVSAVALCQRSALAREMPQTTVRVGVSLVTIPVQVSDRTGKPIGGLSPEDFSVYEDGILQNIALFSSEEQPISIGIVLDKSGSMSELKKIVTARYAALDLIHASHPGTEFSYVVFDDSVTPQVAFTRDRKQLRAAISGTRRAEGGTRLYDAILDALGFMREARFPRKALVVITDGADQDSRHGLADVVSRLQEERAQLYFIGCEPNAVFQRLAEESGAQSFLVSPSEMSQAIHAIATDIRTSYSLSYHVPDPNDTERHRRIQVKIRGKELKVRAPRGYRLTIP